MSRFVCWLLLGHRREVIGSCPVHLTTDTWSGMTTLVLYRCHRCSHVWARRVKGEWKREQVMSAWPPGSSGGWTGPGSC